MNLSRTRAFACAVLLTTLFVGAWIVSPAQAVGRDGLSESSGRVTAPSLSATTVSCVVKYVAASRTTGKIVSWWNGRIRTYSSWADFIDNNMGAPEGFDTPPQWPGWLAVAIRWC
jgi:hypothetical protein